MGFILSAGSSGHGGPCLLLRLPGQVAGRAESGRAVKMAAVVEMEVGVGAAGERELDEVGVESRRETQPET